jgi:hypothetical protein
LNQQAAQTALIQLAAHPDPALARYAIQVRTIDSILLAHLSFPCLPALDCYKSSVSQSRSVLFKHPRTCFVPCMTRVRIRFCCLRLIELQQIQQLNAVLLRDTVSACSYSLCLLAQRMQQELSLPQRLRRQTHTKPSCKLFYGSSHAACTTTRASSTPS